MQTSPGTTRFFPSIYLPHLPPLVPCSYGTSTCSAALSPTIASYTVPVRQARGLPPTSFRFRLTTNTLVFGYVFPATGQTPVFHRLETCAAGRTLKKAYAENAKALEKARKERNMLIGVPGKIHELASYGHRIEALTQKQKKIGYALRIEKEAAENRKDEIDKVLQKMQIENQSKEQTAKKSYKEYLIAKNAEKDLSELMQRLKDEQRNTVIFSKRLPKALTRRMKLYGKERIGNLKFRVLQGQSFAILPNKKDAQTNIIFAVRLGDDIKDGCVPLYELRETSSERTGKSRLTAYRTDKKMPLYDANKSKKDKETTPSSSSTLEAAKRQRYAEIQDKVSSIVNYLTKTQEPVGKLRAHWEEEQLHDKAVQQEEKMYRGWSM